MRDSPSSPTRSDWKENLKQSRLGRVLRYPDFRLLWIGGFLSFTGSRIENLAQGYYVFNITHDESKLALVTFCWSLPVLFFGLATGSFADHFNKRTVLIWAQIIFAVNALYLAVATYYHFVQYWQILVVSVLNGLVACVEMPTRQSLVSRVIPQKDLATAVPINAMTFNVARIAGPAIGGIVLSGVGVAACYFLNGISFLALIWAVWAIKANLNSEKRSPGPIKDIIMEGALYTMRDVRLKALFLLETITAVVGIAYVPLMPAYVEDVLKAPNPKQGLGFTFTAVGIGAMVGLIVITYLSDSPRKGYIIRFSMLTMGVCLFLLAVVRSPYLVYPALAALGMASIMQFNTTNALFQLLAPDRLRGRVLAMHIWALNGLQPFGVLVFGWLASTTKHMQTTWWMPATGVPLSMIYASILMILAAGVSFMTRRGLSNLHPDVPKQEPTRVVK